MAAIELKQASHITTKRHYRPFALLVLASLALFVGKAQALVLAPYHQAASMPSVSSDVSTDSSSTGTGLDWTINTLPAGSSVFLVFKATVLPR